MTLTRQTVERGCAPPPPDCVLRPARALDAGALGRMITEATRKNVWKPRLHSAAEDIAHAACLIDRGWVTVAVQDAAPQAFIAREGAYVHALFTCHGARRRGLASSLLRAAQASARQLDLWTFEANHAARRLYARHGFEEIRRTAGDNDEGLPDIHFRWHCRP